MQQQGQIPVGTQSTHSMISSADVNGTDVYSPQGEHLGHINHLMIDKTSGNISYAVMEFGGFLGIGADQHPLPWKKLRYDTGLAGYVTDLTKAQLENAPAVPADWRESRDYARKAYDYYGVPPYWL